MSQGLPRYLQLFALVSFHAFIKEGVDAAIVEAHHGGEFDATNVIAHPVATVITPLGMDHVQQLGPTIQSIAWHKAGIFKHASPAFSAPQDVSPAEVIRSRASERGISVQFVEHDDSSLPANASQLKPDVQRMNCSLGLAAVRYFLGAKAPKDTAAISSLHISQAVDQFSWPGRFQRIVEGRFNWFLDGAHNEMSVAKAAEWFMDGSREEGMRHTPTRILIFGQISDQRDTAVVLKRLATDLSAVHVQNVIFTSYDRKQSFSPGAAVELGNAKDDSKWQETYGAIWKSVHPESSVHYKANIQQALESARAMGFEAGCTHTLITGSQHLVGGALFLLNSHSII